MSLDRRGSGTDILFEMQTRAVIRTILGVPAMMLLFCGPATGRDPLPSVFIDDPSPPGPGDCLAAGVRQTLRGRFIDPDPSGGENRPPRDLQIDVEPTDGGVERYRGVLSDDRFHWSVPDVDFGSEDGLAVATVVATSADGRIARTNRAWIIDAGSPRLWIETDGTRVPPPGPSGVPSLYGRPIRLDAWVVDSADSAPPVATLELDGAPFKRGDVVREEGVHHLTASVEDCAGHRASAAWAFRLDLTPPPLLSTSPADGAIVTVEPIAFTGVSHADLIAATVNGQQASIASGHFTVEPLHWIEGHNRLKIKLVDESAHSRRYDIGFTVHSLAPTVRILEYGLPIAPGTVFRRPVRPEARATGLNVAVEMLLNDEPFDGGTTIFASGRYRLEVSATDRHGRIAGASVEFQIEIPADEGRRN